MKNNFFNYLGIVSSGMDLDIFEETDSKVQIQCWAEEKFTIEDRMLSEKYRIGLTEKQEELNDKSLYQFSIIDIINSVNEKKPPLHLASYLEDLVQRLPLENTKEARKIIMEKIKKNTLSEFAPYTAYVFTIDYLFYRFFLPKWVKDPSLKLQSKWRDFSYIYYFPFIDTFVSDDKIYTGFVKDVNYFNQITIETA